MNTNDLHTDNTNTRHCSQTRERDKKKLRILVLWNIICDHITYTRTVYSKNFNLFSKITAGLLI